MPKKNEQVPYELFPWLIEGIAEAISWRLGQSDRRMYDTLFRHGELVELKNLFELNEAFAAQSLACIRSLGLADDDPRINVNGGAIALGHPLGMSGARITYSAALELQKRQKRYALATMCIGVGQGYAVILERV